jgi:very-short-patch-repair endonuclease
MAINWDLVTVEHIEQACSLYDAGAEEPARAGRSTFLLFRDRRYPAKFIRGLAYRCATGDELDPDDYGGGLETATFLRRLGLTVEHADHEKAKDVTDTALAPAPVEPSPPVELRERTQKQALKTLLESRFGRVETEVRFDWLRVPTTANMSSPLREILAALIAARGHSEFATTGFQPRCDFYVPSHNLLIEYDEKQHFTNLRATALHLYPTGLKLGFDRSQWITTCERIQARDAQPPYRDEQRAFYDCLRDIQAAQNGFTVIRLMDGAVDWNASNARDELERIVSAFLRSPEGKDDVRRVALVSHDYTVDYAGGLWDYSEHAARINELCDQEGCDTILYSLYTWDERSSLPRSRAAFFNDLAHVRRIILETGNLDQGMELGYPHLAVEVWQRDKPQPIVMRQRFAMSGEPWDRKKAFIDELPSRRIADALVMICGESNIASVMRGSDEFFDPYDFHNLPVMRETRVILNPIHDYMRRYEMREKRRYYSRGGKAVLSVWNRGKGKESALPWTVFHDGEERTETVKELPTPFADRPDIRIGVVQR